MIEGFLIVTFSKCNNPWVDKNQQTPTLTADFQIRHQKNVAFTDFNSLCQFKLIFQTQRWGDDNINFFFIPPVTEKLEIRMSATKLVPPSLPSPLLFLSPPVSQLLTLFTPRVFLECRYSNYQWSKTAQVFLLMLLMYAWHCVSPHHQ